MSSPGSIRTILQYPDPRLHQKALPIERITPELEQLIDDMAETMYAAPSVGLAAPQVGELLRLFLVDVAGEDEPSNLIVFINPEIIVRAGADIGREGCLSSPGHTEIKRRASKVTVRAQNRRGETFELSAEGPLAVAIQHENDHLEGLLIRSA